MVNTLQDLITGMWKKADDAAKRRDKEDRIFFVNAAWCLVELEHKHAKITLPEQSYAEICEECGGEY